MSGSQDLTTYIVVCALDDTDPHGYPCDEYLEFEVSCLPQDLLVAAQEAFRKQHSLICEGEHTTDWFREHPNLRVIDIYTRRSVDCPELNTAIVDLFKRGKHTSLMRSAMYERAHRRKQELAELERLKKKYPQGADTHAESGDTYPHA